MKAPPQGPTASWKMKAIDGVPTAMSSARGRNP